MLTLAILFPFIYSLLPGQWSNTFVDSWIKRKSILEQMMEMVARRCGYVLIGANACTILLLAAFCLTLSCLFLSLNTVGIAHV